MPHDRRAGHDVYWRRFGGGAREALLIHPTLAHSGIWRGVAAHLPLAMTAFDMPGHGRSAPWPGGDYLAGCTEIAESFCTGATDLVGHSFGAIVALRLALTRPDLCRSLTLIEPVFFAAARAQGAPEVAEYDAVNAPFLAAMRAGDRAAAARLFYETWGAGVPWDDLPEDRRATMADQAPLILAAAPALERDTGNMLAPGGLEGVNVPVLLLRGGDTAAVFAAIHRALLARFPDGRERVIPGAGHMLTLTHPGEVAAAIGDRLGLNLPVG